VEYFIYLMVNYHLKRLYTLTSGGKRQGAGRPPLNLTTKKNHSIKFTDGEWESIQTFSSLNKLSVSQFIRMACLDFKEDLRND